MEPFLSFKNVNVARGDAMVLHDINLTIGAGEHVAILGPNGCGKSTLLKTMTCECYPIPSPVTSVSLFGRPRWDLTQMKKRLGVVEPHLPGRPTLATTGRDAVLTGFFASSTLWPNLTITGEMEQRADRILRLIHADDLATVLVGHMSAGQQRRIMIGRALVASSSSLVGAGEGHVDGMMLLLDEPSNALDLAAQRDLRSLLRGLAQGGTGIVLITHHLPDIFPEIERVVLMREGRIVAAGAKQEMLRAEVLSELFGTRIEVAERDGVYTAL